MEVFALYLFRSVIWLTGFALVFILFLRNERFFVLNRIYLITGIMTSFLLPFISIHYTVVLPVVKNIQANEITALNGIQNTSYNSTPDVGLWLLCIYLSGVLFVIFMIVKQSKSVLRAIRKSEINKSHSVKLIRTAKYPFSFSFFSYVFVNPSITDVETEEIVNHELVHIQQKHWFDLVLVELLCMLQWFNPLVWIYIRVMRQNHEYLSDEVALQRTSDPAIYKAALLNQMFSSPVISLSNSFNYSLNKKRFDMMKKIITSPYRKMKVLLVLPVFAIVLYSFAKPEYRYISNDDNSGNKDPVTATLTKKVKGTVVQQDGKPLQGATIMISGTSLGVSADAKGYFRLDNVPEEAMIVVSYVGFKTKIIKPDFTSEMIVTLIRDTIYYGNMKIRKVDGTEAHPLIVLDGVVTNNDINKIDPGTIESISVLKDKSAIDKYGDKSEDGVIEITTKKKTTGENKPDEIIVTGYGQQKKPLIVIDGVVNEQKGITNINPDEISSVNVLKDKAATDKYGEKGKDGVIEVITKKKAAKTTEKKEPERK